MSRGCEPYGLASAAVQRSRYTSVGVQILTPLWVPNCLNTSAPGYRILKIAPIDHAAHPRVVDGATVSVAATCLASRAHRIGEEAPDSAPEPPRPSVAVPRPSPARSRTGGDELDPGRSRAQGCPFGTKCVSEGGLEHRRAPYRRVPLSPAKPTLTRSGAAAPPPFVSSCPPPCKRVPLANGLQGGDQGRSLSKINT